MACTEQTIIQVKTIVELASVFAIGKKVFVKEQGISEKLDFDTYDHKASHIIGELRGGARSYPEDY